MVKKALPLQNIREVGQRLESIRFSTGLTRTAIGQRMGVSDVSVMRWERGDAEPPLAYLVYLCENFGYDLNWLLLGKETSAASPQPQSDLEKELLLENRALAKENKELMQENAELKNGTLSSLAALNVPGEELGKA